MELVELEYKQWLFINHELYKYFNKICMLSHIKEKKEGKNVIQHWFLVINENKNLPKYLNFPLLSPLRLEDSIAQNLVNAIMEKKFFWRNERSESENAVSKLLKFIDDSHEKYSSMSFNLELFVQNGTVICGEFSSKSFKNLLPLLNEYPVESVTTMLLRYESLGNGSYQWGDPTELHLTYYNFYNVVYEGFASPINSRFLTLRNCRFCSLFPEIDSQFGSLGNFFDIDLTNYPGGWSVNPPFVNCVLEAASKKIIAALEAGTKSWYFCTFPFWIDCEGWILLNNSRYLLKKYDRQTGAMIENAYGKIIRPPIRMSLFCLGYHHSCMNFDKIDEVIKLKKKLICDTPKTKSFKRSY